MTLPSPLTYSIKPGKYLAKNVEGGVYDEGGKGGGKGGGGGSQVITRLLSTTLRLNDRNAGTSRRAHATEAARAVSPMTVAMTATMVVVVVTATMEAEGAVAVAAAAAAGIAAGRCPSRISLEFGCMATGGNR